MGWTFGWASKEALVDYILRDEALYEDKALVGNHLWVAGKSYSQDPETAGKGIIFLYLIKKSGGEWGYKDLSEAEVPNATSVPLRFFKLFPPICKSAADWREIVLKERSEKRSATKAAQKAKPGDVVAYGGNQYRLMEPTAWMGGKKKGWIVNGLTGGFFRMSNAMLKEALQEAAAEAA